MDTLDKVFAGICLPFLECYILTKGVYFAYVLHYSVPLGLNYMMRLEVALFWTETDIVVYKVEPFSIQPPIS